MGYDILSKMVLFKNHNRIDCGIEVVVVSSMIKEMSTGVSSFDQIVLDLKERGDLVKTCGSSHDQAASSLIPSTN